MREVAYLCVGGGRQNLTKYNNAPLSVIKIVKYYKVGRGGIGGGAPKCYKNIGALLLFVNKMAKYCDVWGGGGAPKSYQR